jgi:predicted N-acetyltransferase YhbS
MKPGNPGGSNHMADMLVQLLKLPPVEPLITQLRADGIAIRRANSWETSRVTEFIRTNFGPGWADEVLPSLMSQPVSLFVAVAEGKLIGFAAYEATHKNFFGPTGVRAEERGRGIGLALLLSCLWGMRHMGYAYAIIGSAGPKSYYEKAVGATLIPDSEPGIYADGLH